MGRFITSLCVAKRHDDCDGHAQAAGVVAPCECSCHSTKEAPDAH